MVVLPEDFLFTSGYSPTGNLLHSLINLYNIHVAMKIESQNTDTTLLLVKSHAAYDRLQTLITDPLGTRFFVEKSPVDGQVEFEKQIERTAALLNFFGNPQDKYHSIHVAGTGGKGSVATMIGALLVEAGFKVGIHTSPFLQVPNEKLLINGKMIPPSRFIDLVENFMDGLEDFSDKNPNLKPKYGEAWVALTHLYFAGEKVDWGIIETGCGGRYDPTNVLNPEVSVITNIDFDHVARLGSTLAAIASHKAGIIKNDTPVVTAERKPEALDVIKNEATAKQAKILCAGEDFSFEIQSLTPKGSRVDIHTPFGNFKDIDINLPGVFQPENAATAITAVQVAAARKQFTISMETISSALKPLKFPGRMEIVQDRPTVILDGAHNPQKMEALTLSLSKAFNQLPYTLVVGMLATKDASGSLLPILKNARRVIVTSPNVLGKPSIGPDKMKGIVESLAPEQEVKAFDNVKLAIAYAKEISAADDLIVVTGSIYMLGEARGLWFPSEDLLIEAEYGNKN